MEKKKLIYVNKEVFDHFAVCFYDVSTLLSFVRTCLLHNGLHAEKSQVPTANQAPQ